MFKHAFCSSCPALQFEPGTKFFHRAVPELHSIKNSENFSTTTWCFCIGLLKTMIYKKCQAEECSLCHEKSLRQQHYHPER